MEGTPRLRSAFPATPVSVRSNSNQNGSSVGVSGRVSSRGTSSKLPEVPQSMKSSEETQHPLIPFEVIDAPSQRLYVLAVYGGITAWRFYDFWKLMTDDADPLWLFMKWVLVDGAFLYGLPGLRIPWLEWSFTTITVLFIFHALLDGLLMFRVPIPLQAWVAAIVKVLYDRELSISENRVKPADILHNSSLILGKQIIHILPEGSAVLNPQQQSFCLGAGKSTLNLPIQINQTHPILMELLRIDLDTQYNETIKISASQIKSMKKLAEKKALRSDEPGSLFLDFPVKKAGLYRLQKVVDESKLEVQRRHSDTLVVTCPKAFVRPAAPNKCKGQLSDFSLEVEGTPPLKIKYSRTVNKEDRGFSFQSIQPENLVSPLIRQRTGGLLIPRDSVDVSWARPHRISVPLNESLSTGGEWLYSVEEVHDACGNIANYTQYRDEWEISSPKAAHLEQIFRVHEKPKAALRDHDQQHPLRVAKGETTQFPLQIVSPHGLSSDSTYTFTYLFTPAEQLQPDGEHSPDALMQEIRIHDGQQTSDIQTPGLYSLRSISSEYCSGEVFEPTTFLLLNPPEPDLSITYDNIYDKCAGNPIGLLVDLDLIGTPPFSVLYEVQRAGEKQTHVRFERIDRIRGQIELRPQEAGHYSYHFREISDAVYKGHSLKPKNLVLEQDVKPPASAHLVGGPSKKQACIDEPASFDVKLQGESPWILEYEVVHGGKRNKYKIKGIESDNYVITTDKLVYGGDYSVTLTSVTDKSGCKIGLGQEAKIQVRHQRPKAAFGQIEEKREALMLEGKRIDLPLRLTGEGPWTIKYQNVNSSAEIRETRLSYSNDIIDVSDEGIYEILDVHDAICPGSVDAYARSFKVSWIPRPRIDVADSSTTAREGEKFIQNDVCEGDDDAVQLTLQGTPPYHVKYEQRLTPKNGATSLTTRDFTAGLGVASIRMETTWPGLYEYRFNELSDYLYDHNPQRYHPLIIRQKVHEKPSAKFLNSGKTYKFCKEAEFGDDVIPVLFTGVAPFSAEIRIKHHSNPKPEVINIANINSNNYEFRIPHRLLALGNHVVTVHKVRDSRGCQRTTEQDAPYVQVIVADVPAISPLDLQTDFCVGERISYTLSGTPPFGIFYNFQGIDRKATSSSTTFRRIAEKPGNFTIYAVTDGMHECKAKTQITRMIHEMPSVKISKGRETVVDIHEGGEAEIIFDFWGTPPFEFTYTRSTNAMKGRRSQVLETKHDVSYEHSKTIRASEEGTYEVIAIKDRFCAFSTHRVEGRSGQKLLQ